jgi:uncharacterized protein with PhoU and TrkA domain
VEVPLVDRMDVQAMTKDRVQLTLYYAGAQSQLSVAMAQHDLALSQKDGVWVIAFARGGQAAGSAPPVSN